MIRKILLLILVVILAMGLWNSFASGVVLPIKIDGKKIETKSYTSLLASSRELAENKAKLQKANDEDYPTAVRLLEAQKNAFKINKAAYDDMAANASLEEIRSVNQTKEYLLDYIWMKIGTYANDNDVKVLIDPDYEKDMINFDISGQYIAVINFIYDLERDDDLSLTVDNIVMQGGSSDSVTRANFFVSNIKIVTSEKAD